MALGGRMLWTQDKVLRVVFWGLASYVGASILGVVGLTTSWTLEFTSAWLLSAGLYLYMANMKEPTRDRAVVVTGCDCGFGHTLALHLHKLGFRVFAGCLQEEGEGARSLKRIGSGRLHVLQMDVTKQEQLDKALQEVKRILPDGEVLWGLVNNAGLCTLGPTEWLSAGAFRRDPEVNVFGLIAVTKTFLPLVRRAQGRVVNVASVAGRVSAGFMGAYSASKYAVEGFNDALRQEMRPFGVQVCLIEPGNFANGTNLFATDDAVEREVDALWTSLSPDLQQDYKGFGVKVKGFMKNFRKMGAHDISPVVNAFTEALTQTHPQPRYQPMCPLTFLVAFVNTHLPEWVYDYLVRLLAFVMLKKEELL